MSTLTTDIYTELAEANIAVEALRAAYNVCDPDMVDSVIHQLAGAEKRRDAILARIRKGEA